MRDFLHHFYSPNCKSSTGQKTCTEPCGPFVPFNHVGLPWQVRQYGMRFRCLLGIAEHYMQQTLTVTQIHQIYDIARTLHNVMNENCLCTQEEHRITKMAFLALKNKQVSVRPVNIQHRNRKHIYIIKQPQAGDYCIKEWYIAGGQTLVTLHDKNDILISDFWDATDKPEPLFWQMQTHYKICYAKSCGFFPENMTW